MEVYSMEKVCVGVIGGSGLYNMGGLEEVEELHIPTPFGDPSDSYVIGRLAGRKVAFLARHGRGHRLMPSELNYRANIYGFKKLGVQRIISASAVGSLKEEMPPLDIVLPDQFIDRTTKRVSTFFGDGIVAHVSMADPICPELQQLALRCSSGMDRKVHLGGTYLNMEGPHFSTRAESMLYRSWGLDVIGMTNSTEARLAREAEICYVTVAMVTDYDCWREEEEPVSVETLIGFLNQNADFARNLITRMVAELPETSHCGCGSALENAIISRPDAISPDVRERLAPIIGKYLS
jgi:5'-methylthioadenosine phosphorylase